MSGYAVQPLAGSNVNVSGVAAITSLPAVSSAKARPPSDAEAAVYSPRAGVSNVQSEPSTGSSAPLTAPPPAVRIRSDEITSEVPSLTRITHTVYCLKQKNNYT